MTDEPRDNGPQVLNTTRARQARWGRPVFWVLLFGTVLSALGMFAAWTWQRGVEGEPGRSQEQVSGAQYDVAAPPSPTRQ